MSLGLVNPFTIAAAILGTLAFAALEGSKELRAFQTQSTLTGNAIALTASQFTQLRSELGTIATQGKAAETLTAIAASGAIAGANIKLIGEAAILMEKATGQSIEKTVAQFAELAHSPAEAAAKLNEQFNFLTASVYKQIKALQDQGRLVDAQNLAEKTYADALKTRAQSVLDSAGTMEKAWRGVSSIAKKAWDDMLGIGRTLSPAEQLAQAAAKVAEIQAQIKAATSFSETAGGAAVGRTGGANLASLQRQLEAARELQRMAEQRVDGERSVGAALAANNRLQQLGIQYQQDGEQFLTQQELKKRELNKARDGRPTARRRWNHQADADLTQAVAGDPRKVQQHDGPRRTRTAQGASANRPGHDRSPSPKDGGQRSGGSNSPHRRRAKGL
jgi:phage-related minor tail protein